MTSEASGSPLARTARARRAWSPGFGVVLGGAAAVTRVMALPVVKGSLRRLGLATDDPLGDGGAA